MLFKCGSAVSANEQPRSDAAGQVVQSVLSDQLPGSEHEDAGRVGLISSSGRPSGATVYQCPVGPSRISQWLRTPEMFESLAWSVWVQ